MNEEVTDYVKVIKNDPQKRDEQILGYIEEAKTIHDDAFDNGINNYNTDIRTLLMSFVERLSYLDLSRKNYSTYQRFADFIGGKSKREADYDVSAKKEDDEKNKSAYGIVNVLKGVSDNISNPEFRIYLILIGVGVFKDEGTITKKQREFLDEMFESLQIDN